MQFDPAVIDEFARRLNTQARSTIIGLALVGALAGAGGAVSINMSLPYGVVGALIGGLLGFAIGQQRAFSLRLIAQTALCQVAIERNTRELYWAVRGGAQQAA